MKIADVIHLFDLKKGESEMPNSTMRTTEVTEVVLLAGVEALLKPPEASEGPLTN